MYLWLSLQACFFQLVAMSSIISPQSMVLATAMAVSGTVVLLVLRLQKSLPVPATQFHVDPLSQSLPPTKTLRSCISTEGKKSSEKKKKRRVHFAEDVVDPSGDGKQYRRRQIFNNSSSCYSSSTSPSTKLEKSSRDESRGIMDMPANRVALYNGILRNRGVQRLTYSY
ncbi:hypothetical protein I3843_04G160700 [Carya illinoinensis]|uniref:Uncharacterized protein n=2 Tax=Carya illinoinensis TaxID=32201 RepID=A0A922F9Y2_CARIL|nr:uncharacterized protein LOC122307652 [Carya illinoinensis]KAG2713272.1 hypothetical protein I3760_04G169800 [Carya illinoinensis]KAG6718783.1 hypothetical protein I3842_04G170900 [Carya illinoinensis]KAG7984417.1 hypothetical protein I3843_04G160700 [Carya illinoinensis]